MPMVANYKLQFGSYTFPRGFAVVEDAVHNIVPQQKLARGDGARVLRGSLGPRQIRVRGTLFGPRCLFGVSNFRTELDSMLNALHPNAPASMYAGRDDRFLRNVSCETPFISYDPSAYGRYGYMDLAFITGDPFYYSTNTVSDIWAVAATAETRTFTPAGIEPVQPVFSITVGGSGAITIAFSIQNTTTGKSFTLAGAVTGGDTIVVDTLQQTVTIAGVDKMSLFDGIWVALVAGTSNTIGEGYTSGTITQIQTDYRNRYL